MLECKECGDKKSDAEQRGQGMSLGARCVWIDCSGTYQDPK